MFWSLDGMVEGPVWTGPTNMVDGHRAYRPGVLFFLGLRTRSAEQWSSAKAFANQLPQVITYPRYASLRGTSSLEMGVVLCPHVSGLQQDRKFSFLIYDGMRPWFMMACFASFLP